MEMQFEFQFKLLFLLIYLNDIIVLNDIQRMFANGKVLNYQNLSISILGRHSLDLLRVTPARWFFIV